MYQQKDGLVQQEFQNVYYDISKVKTDPLATSSATVSALSVSTLNVTGSASIKGTATNDNAATGYIGEIIEAVGITVVDGATTVWSDAVSVSLTAGDWRLSAQSYNNANTATVSSYMLGISTTSGNSNAGLVVGDSQQQYTVSTPTTNTLIFPLTINPKRFSLAATTTVYLKIRSDYTAGGPPFVNCRLTAERRR
jgi:hypothetical protein